MTLYGTFSLFVIMLTLALIPSASVALVVTRSVTHGIANGVAASLGIAAGDLLFILLAILGLSVVAHTMGGAFLAIRYLGAAYLLWIGYKLLISREKTAITVSNNRSKGSLISSFLAGFLLTLGDFKAIFFYVSLFPTFIDISTLNSIDISIILLITIVTVGGVKIAYAVSANSIAGMSRGLKLENSARIIAGSFMIGAGSYLILKT